MTLHNNKWGTTRTVAFPILWLGTTMHYCLFHFNQLLKENWNMIESTKLCEQNWVGPENVWKLPKMTLFGIFNQLLSTKNDSSLRSQCLNETFSVIFKHCDSVLWESILLWVCYWFVEPPGEHHSHYWHFPTVFQLYCPHDVNHVKKYTCYECPTQLLNIFPTFFKYIPSIGKS